MKKTERELRKAVVAAAREAAAAGLMPGTAGNVSARLGEGFLVTPSGIPYGRVTEDLIVRMDLGGSFAGTIKPSSEWRMHADIYRERADAHAIVHTHSPHATALSALRLEIPAFHYMVALAGGSSIRCAAYATFGTPELSRNVIAALAGRKACLIANHGVTVFERDLARAVRLAEEVELLAKEYAIARQLGEPAILEEAEMARVFERFAGYGVQDGAAGANDEASGPSPGSLREPTSPPGRGARRQARRPPLPGGERSPRSGG